MKFHLYAPRGPDGRRDDSLEKKLADLETWFGTSIWNSVCTDSLDLSWEPLRKLMALVVATTYLRNPLQFEQTKNIHRQLVDLISSGPTLPDAIEINGMVRSVNLDDWPAYRDATEDDLKRAWGEQVSTARWLAEMLLKMRWAVIFSEEPVFITSDNPVTIMHPSLQFRGLKSLETTVSFPLSPTRILIMDNRHGEPNYQYYPLRKDPGSLNCLICATQSGTCLRHVTPTSSAARCSRLPSEWASRDGKRQLPTKDRLLRAYFKISSQVAEH